MQVKTSHLAFSLTFALVCAQGCTTQDGSLPSAASLGAADAGSPPASFPSVTDFAARGPYATVTEASPAKCKVWRPTVLGSGGVRHPAIVWGNGTLGFPAVYTGLLDHWASHGFVVIAANTPNAGTGEEMRACLDWLSSENSRTGSVFAGKLDLAHMGVSGHSQGGGGAIMLGRDPRVTTTAPLMPYVQALGHVASSQSQQHGPMFLISGRTDTIAPASRDQAPVFEAANVPVFWGLLETAGHLAALGDGGHFRGPMTAWFRAQLMNDSAAHALFYGPACGLCTDATWQVQRKGF